MKRRNLIKIMGLGVATAAAGGATLGLSNQLSNQDTHLIGWDQSQEMDDIRLTVLSYALLAPNAHNKQPWLIKLGDKDEFELFVDRERLLPETDPYHRQTHIGQGAFLELASIAASAYGYRAEIEYFPNGEYDAINVANLPVAKVTLVKDAAVVTNPFYPAIMERHSNKRAYSPVALTTQELDDLQTFICKHSGGEMRVITKPKDAAKMRELLVQAMEIEVTDKQRDLETIKMFRFNDDEVKHHRDGFGVAQSGTVGMKKWLAESFFLSRESAERNTAAFGQQSVAMTKEVADSTQCFAWLSTPSNTRLDQVKLGRDYCRLNLYTQLLGIAQHPMSQLLQEYKDMLPLQAQYKKTFGIAEGDTVQMLFRLGKAEACPHSPRRAISDLLV